MPLSSRELPPRKLTLADRTVLASKRRSGLTRGIVLSVAAHLLLLGGTLLWAKWAPTRVVPEKPIVARLVRLGEPRDERLLPRLPQEPKTPPPARTPPPEPPPPPEPARVETPPPPAPTAPTPAPADPTPAKATAPVDPPKAETKRPETPPTPTPTPEAKSKAPEPTVDADAERRRRMAQALEGLVPPAQGPFGTTESTPEGRPDGDPRGTADDAEEGDRYIALVVQALKSNYVVPAVIPQRERLYLSAKLRLVIAPNGRISSWQIEESSGNEHFDRAVETSIQRTTFPPPPQAFLATYGRDGIGFEFKP